MIGFPLVCTFRAPKGSAMKQMSKQRKRKEKNNMVYENFRSLSMDTLRARTIHGIKERRRRTKNKKGNQCCKYAA
jgi:hypothetical protein